MIKEKKLILGLGHPRTGTGTLSQLLKSCHLMAHHEAMGPDGIVSWQFAAKNAQPPLFAFHKYPTLQPSNFEFEVVIHTVRNPLHSLPSIVYTENSSKQSLAFRTKYGNFTKSSNSLLTAILSLLSWEKLILANEPSFTFRVEDQTNLLLEFLQAKCPNKFLLNTLEVGKVYNKRSHPDWEQLIKDIAQIPEEHLLQLNEYCIRYGYEPIFNVQHKKLQHG